MQPSTLIDRRQLIVSPEIIRIVKHAGVALPAPEDAEAFDPFFDLFGDARVVVLDEATHGTAEFYRARAATTRRLIEKHGFTIVALALARRRYGCLTPWQDDPTRYGYEATFGGEDCEKEAVEQLVALLARRIEYMCRDGDDFLDAEQNARVVRSAEEYYRIMYRGSRESGNVRDRHMFETLRAALARRGTTAKAVVWAHNSHVGNAAATAMGWAGESNIGELCRTALAEKSVSIGFGTDRGTVAAAPDWGHPVEFKSVLPARHDSYEHLFRKTGLARSLTDWRGHDRPDLIDALTGPLLERAIGVVYRPDTEFLSHYFEAALAEQFDAFVWFEETHAVKPLPGPLEPGMPDIYPSGV